MQFVDKVFPHWEKKNFFTLVGGVLAATFILIIPAAVKLLANSGYLSGIASSGWARFIFAQLLFLVQAFFFFLHPACRCLLLWGRSAIAALLLYLLACLLSPLLNDLSSIHASQELLKLLSASSLLFLLLYFSYKKGASSLLLAVAVIGSLFATGEAIIGLGQYLVQSDLGLQWLGEKKLHVDTAAAIKFQEGAANGIDQLRTYGTFDHPNHFGGILLAGFLLSLYWLCQMRSRLLRFFLILAMSLQAMALATTFSRSAWFGAAIAFAAILAWRVAARVRGGPRHMDKLYFLAFSLTLCLTCLVFHRQILQRCFPEWAKANTTFSVMEELKLDWGRLQFLEIAKNMVAHNPWKGVGYRQFVPQMAEFTETKLEKHQRLPVHNIYLLVAAEVGIPGAAAFVLFVLLTAAQGAAGLLRDKKEPIWALWAAIALIGFFDNYFLFAQAGRVLFFTAAALVLAQSRQSRSVDLVR